MPKLASGTTWGTKIDQFFGKWKCTKQEGDSHITLSPGICSVSLLNAPVLADGPYAGVFDETSTELTVSFLLEAAGVDQMKKVLRYGKPTVGFSPSGWFSSEDQATAPQASWGSDPDDYLGTWTEGAKQIVITEDDLTISSFEASDGLPNGTYYWGYRPDLKALEVRFRFTADGFISGKKELTYTSARVISGPPSEIVVPTEVEVYEEEDGGEPDYLTDA